MTREYYVSQVCRSNLSADDARFSPWRSGLVRKAVEARRRSFFAISAKEWSLPGVDEQAKSGYLSSKFVIVREKDGDE